MAARSQKPGVRPPSLLAPRRAPNPLEALRHELVEEQVATLFRLGRRLEETLEALVAFEREAETERNTERREALLAEAGEAAWHFVVQREAMGLSNTEAALRHYRVPPSVRVRMGARRASP